MEPKISKQLNSSRSFEVTFPLTKDCKFLVTEIVDLVLNKKHFTVESLDEEGKKYEDLVGTWFSNKTFELPAMKKTD